MRALVTGGAGFIGSALVRHLAGCKGWFVHTVDALTEAGNLRNLDTVLDHPLHRFTKADIRDRAAMDGVFSEARPDVVFHLAAETHVDRSIDGPERFIATNVAGTGVVLAAALDAWRAAGGGQPDPGKRFVHVSTDEVYGSLGPTGRFTEASPYAPRSPYSATKAASDHLALAWFHTYGLPVCVTHSSNNYGPFQLPEKLIPLTILNALEGRDLPVYGDGLNVRDWLHVDDHVRALEAIATNGQPGESYLVGANAERSNLEVVTAICALLDELRPGQAAHGDRIRLVADRPGHDRRYAVDAGKLSGTLGWTPQLAFADGLRQTVQWYIDNPDWWTPLRRLGHGRDRLGLGTAQTQDSAL